jgi:hypothetical protein
VGHRSAWRRQRRRAHAQMVCASRWCAVQVGRCAHHPPTHTHTHTRTHTRPHARAHTWSSAHSGSPPPISSGAFASSSAAPGGSSPAPLMTTGTGGASGAPLAQPCGEWNWCTASICARACVCVWGGYVCVGVDCCVGVCGVHVWVRQARWGTRSPGPRAARTRPRHPPPPHTHTHLLECAVAAQHLAKHGVVPVQRGGWRERDEKLAAVGARLTQVGGRQRERKRVPGAPRAVVRGGWCGGARKRDVWGARCARARLSASAVLPCTTPPCAGPA